MKKAYITIRDTHYTDNNGEPEYGELKTDCTVRAENDSIIIEYRETVESPGDCNTSLTVSDGKVTMMRNGRFRTAMMFENGKRNACCYATPFGEAMIGVYTNALFADISEDGGVIHLAYTVDSAGDLLTENELKITVEMRDDDYVSFG